MARKRKQRVSDDPVSAGKIPPPIRRKDVDVPGWKRGTDALQRVTSVRTIFPSFNFGVRVGGLPTRRLHTVHGATHGGKSAFVLGMIKSFLLGGHYAALVDAERSTPQEFGRELLGDQLDSDRFFGMLPDSYEDTIDGVDEYLDHVAKKRKQEPGIASLCVVDSLTKLSPKRELANVVKGGGDEVAKGHHGRYRAALNQAWLDHITPKLDAANCAMLIVVQEREQRDDRGEIQYRPKGGTGILFDSSLLMRISKSMPMRDPPNKEGRIIGFAHKVRVYKSKVGHMDGRWTDTFFHLSNGAQGPAGFDTARDLVSVGKSLGLIKASGSWLSWGKKRWQGESRAVRALNKSPELLASLTDAVSAAIDSGAGR